MSDTRTSTDTVILTVNGRQIEAAPGELVIEAAERNGTYIPRFCYHPRLEPVGMCRMCIVEIDTGRGPSLQPACMIPVAPDMVVDTESDVTKKAQDGVLEFLLINHPLDCPVCDKGGECPLQDQTMSYGPGESRFVEEKRHFEKPISISDLVALDRERCILCDRCTRFANDVAGDTLIHFQDRGNETQVNTFPDHPFASYFSGNTVQICPVGALTAKPFRFKARPWDLDQVESTCTTCAVGCRILVQSSRNEIVRYSGVDIDPVNWGWLCDKGRFGFQSINSPERLGTPLVRGSSSLGPVGWGPALSKAAAALRGADPSRIAVLGGAHLTNEDAFAWAKLAKGVIGTDNVDAQLGDGLPAEVVLGLPRATIDQTCSPGGTILVIAPDLKEELPVLFLRLRHAVVNDGATVVEVSPRRTSVSDLAAVSLLHSPGGEGEVVRALLAGSTERPVAGIEPEAVAMAATLLQRGPVSVIIGRTSTADSGAGVVAAAAAIHEAHPEVGFLSALRRANVHGALDMGLAPGVLPGRTDLATGGDWYRRAGWDKVPTARGMDATGILAAAAAGRIDVLVLLGSDPISRFPDTALATKAVAGARTVIAVEQFLTSAAKEADVVLPAAGWTEVDGSTTNIEGRVSTVSRKITPPGTARSDWMIAAELARLLGADLGITSVEEIWEQIEALAPSHAGLRLEALRGRDGRDGVVVPLIDGLPKPPPDEISSTEGAAPSDGGDSSPAAIADSGVAQDAGQAAVAAEAADTGPDTQDAQVDAQGAQSRAQQAADEDPDPPADKGPLRPGPLAFSAPDPSGPPAPDAYSLRLVVTRKLYDRSTATKLSPAIADLSTENALRLHPQDFDRLGIAVGATVTITASSGSIKLPAVPDDGVPKGSAAVLVNQAGPVVGTLIDAGATVTDVRVERA